MDRKKYRIGPDWFGFVALLAAIFVALYFLTNHIRPNLSMYTFSGLHIVLFVGIAVAAARGYTPDAEGIAVDILGIPAGKLRWSRIRDICVVRRKRLGQQEILMILTLWGCDLFRPGKDDLDNYLSKHPFKAISITLSAKKAAQHIENFRLFTDKIREVEL